MVLHGRNPERAEAALDAAPGAAHAVFGDLSEVEETRRVADQVNALGRFDAVIHNAGVGYREPRRVDTPSGASHVFAINVLAPYILTALIERPDRLVYLSSGMHHGVRPRLDDMLWTERRWEGASAYAESKFYDVALAFAVARLWPEVLSNALEPGWVPTKMGGPGAPDDMSEAPVTQAWLSVSDDKLAQSTGAYFYHQKLREPNAAARDAKVQDALLDLCGRLSGVRLASFISGPPSSAFQARPGRESSVKAPIRCDAVTAGPPGRCCGTSRAASGRRRALTISAPSCDGSTWTRNGRLPNGMSTTRTIGLRHFGRVGVGGLEARRALQRLARRCPA